MESSAWTQVTWQSSILFVRDDFLYKVFHNFQKKKKITQKTTQNWSWFGKYIIGVRTTLSILSWLGSSFQPFFSFFWFLKFQEESFWTHVRVSHSKTDVDVNVGRWLYSSYQCEEGKRCLKPICQGLVLKNKTRNPEGYGVGRLYVSWG